MRHSIQRSASARGGILIRVTFRRATPSRVMPISLAARAERSRLLPPTNGPQSLMRTLTERPFFGFSTRTTEPSGTVTEAAVSRRGLKRSPLVVSRPANPAPYQDANTSWMMGFGAPREPEMAGIALTGTGCDAAGAALTAYPAIANGRLRRSV